MSPCPCGLVIIWSPPSFNAIVPELFIKAGTFSYLISVTCDLFIPKYSFFSNRSKVLDSVSLETIIANGM